MSKLSASTIVMEYIYIYETTGVYVYIDGESREVTCVCICLVSCMHTRVLKDFNAS